MNWGRALFDCGGSTILLIFEKLRILFTFLWSQTIGAKVYSREGNSPDYAIRASIKNLVRRVWRGEDNHEVGLEAAIFLRKRNSSLTELFCLENLKRLKFFPESVKIGSRTFCRPEKIVCEHSWRYQK